MHNRDEHSERVATVQGPAIGPGGRGRGMGGGEKAQNFGKSLKRLVAYCRRYWLAIVAAVLMAAVATTFSIIGPDKISEITDLITAGIVTGIDLEAVASIGLLLAALYGIGFVLNYTQGFIMATVTQRVSKDLRRSISRKINRLPLSYFDRVSYGEVLSRVTNDVDTIGQSLGQSFGTIVTVVVSLVGALIMMFATNWVMALSALVATLVGFVLMMVIVSRSQKYFSAQQRELGSLNGHIEESYSGHSVVRVYNATGEAVSTFRGINGKLYSSAWKAQFMSGLMQPLMSFVGNFGYVVVCVVGAILAMQGSITFGVIVAFMMYVRLFTQPLSQLAQAATSLQSAAAASERVFDLLDADQLAEESGAQTLDRVDGDVSFENVRFGYSSDKTIINDFSLDAKAGQKVAIVGPTGAGKTTIVNLLMRFYELGGGAIKVDGVPISDMTRESVHDLFCMVLQDTWLFEGTIKENIIYSKQGISDEQVIEACKAVGMHDFIMTLPQGYDTVLSDNANLSAGQKQLLTIARAMVSYAPLLILDEATSSVDTRTELLIQQAMDQLMVGRTSFVIAHRLSTIKNADLILVMRDGDIVESGSHQALLEQSGFYAELYNSQFEQAA